MRAFPLPSWHTLGRWLRGFDAGGVKALLEVNERLVADVIDHSGLPRLIVDGSVVSTGLRVEGARRGFNPHRRNSYYPITAYEANTGQVLRVCNRAGNVHDGQASLGFLVNCSTNCVRRSNAGRCWRCAWTGRFSRRL